MSQLSPVVGEFRWYVHSYRPRQRRCSRQSPESLQSPKCGLDIDNGRLGFEAVFAGVAVSSALGDTDGHLNPAFTLASVLMTGNPMRLVTYIPAQACRQHYWVQ